MASLTDTAALARSVIDSRAKGAGWHLVRLTAEPVSAPLTLRSHVTLALDAGATLLCLPDMADYPIRVADAPWRRVSLLHADHVTDISITGAGTIDGNGKVWWDAKAAAPKGTPENQRPLLIDLTNSQQILIDGVTVKNSPQYTITTFGDGSLVRKRDDLHPPGAQY